MFIFFQLPMKFLKVDLHCCDEFEVLILYFSVSIASYQVDFFFSLTVAAHKGFYQSQGSIFFPFFKLINFYV